MASRQSSGIPNEQSGLKSELASFSKDAGAFLKARAELLAIESQEAGQVFGKRFALIATAVFFFVIGYLGFLLATVHLLGSFLESKGPGTLLNWVGAALILAVLHLIVGIICFLRQRSLGKKTNLFEYTRSEWQKDQQWIQHNEKPN